MNEADGLIKRLQSAIQAYQAWKDVTSSKDDGVIRMSFNCQRHDTTDVDLSPNVKPIDTEIAVLVGEMNKAGIHTVCSCQGENGGQAYISIKLGDGIEYEHRKDILGQSTDELVFRWIRSKQDELKLHDAAKLYCSNNLKECSINRMCSDCAKPELTQE